jgi:UPF0755 protein
VKRLLGCLLVLALLAAAAAFLVHGWARRDLATPHAFAAPGATRDFVVAPGETTRAILERLERQGLLRSALVARLYHSRVLGDPPLQAGEYRFVSPISAERILAMLRDGEVLTLPLTVVEGLTIFEAAEAIARAGFGDRERLLAEFSDPRRIAPLDPDAASLEGYLFPDTYRFPRGVSEKAVADALVANFRTRFERDVRPLLAADDARTPREIVVLASLVEKEARLDAERPLVAAVYANRLRRGMGLYADPTIIYGLKLAGRWDGDLRRRDLEWDSPCLYFVSRNDGSHVFSTTLAEHNRNVEIWQRRYFRERRAAERAAGNR